MRSDANVQSARRTQAPLQPWHAFAVGVPVYPPEASIPPRGSHEVSLFAALFSTKGTAGNYVSHIYVQCEDNLLGTSWHDVALRRQLAVINKLDARLAIQTSKIEMVLTWAQVKALVILNNRMGTPGAPGRHLAACEILARVIYEVMPIKVGMATNASMLPAERHCGLFFDDIGTACLRLRSRKHRPQGSLLRSPSR